ncbi:hypothetical protein [Shinella sp. G-2]|uniref:hypothetical protein n=1 Tax=Shinella sp. G-2 TaxID=3133141 RepID=UPI003D046959
MAEADRFEIDYTFEEVRLIGDGLMAWGTAVLIEDNDDDFYVDRILIDGKRLDRAGTGAMGFPSTVNKALFEAIARQIETSRDAQETFAEAISAHRADSAAAA